MTADPNSTPITNATCCFHGVAPTSWPVLRSCRLSLEMVATPNTMAAVNRVNATSACTCESSVSPKVPLMRIAAISTTRMSTPEIGLLDDPMSTGHVTADRRHRQTDDEDEKDAHRDDSGGAAVQDGIVREIQHERDRNSSSTRMVPTMVTGMSRSVSQPRCLHVGRGSTASPR